jgi:uncharacterized membrane protein YhaH (DUF805 family)
MAPLIMLVWMLASLASKGPTMALWVRRSVVTDDDWHLRDVDIMIQAQLVFVEYHGVCASPTPPFQIKS